MFTGIVEDMGRVAALERRDSGLRVHIEADRLDSMSVGDSMAVNGTCLTVVEAGAGRLAFDVVPETVSRTNLGDLGVGDLVDLERPLSASGRFDGHIVQGHVDGVGVVGSVRPDGEGARMVVEAPPEVARYLVEKGSVTVDGVSLTVAGVDRDSFEVALIPHTLSLTVLGRRRPGDRVNLEVDVLAKYVERLLGAGS